MRAFAKSALIGLQTATGADARARARQAREGPGVRVCLGHGTPKRHADAFRRQVEWTAKYFELVDFARFKLIAQGQEKLKRPAAMFTFDDGLRDNLEIGAGILEEFNTRGLFFVVPGFCRQPNSDASRRYYLENLKGADTGDHAPMSPGQVTELAQRGHTIGNHTYSHVRLSETPVADLEHEINDSADELEAWVGSKIESFAWTFYYNAITPEAYRTIVARHDYCFTPCPGLFRPGADSPKLIWRTNAEASAPLSLVRFMYSGLADNVWGSRRAELQRMLSV